MSMQQQQHRLGRQHGGDILDVCAKAHHESPLQALHFLFEAARRHANTESRRSAVSELMFDVSPSPAQCMPDRPQCRAFWTDVTWQQSLFPMHHGLPAAARVKAEAVGSHVHLHGKARHAVDNVCQRPDSRSLLMHSIAARMVATAVQA